MTNPTAPLLSESEVSEIEARANAASQSYVVDWSKGEHALLQASGWRPANEEQPRTIATFDKEDGYLDLLFCAEARTDIPALIRDLRALSEMVYVPKILPDDEPLTYRDEAERLLRQNAALREQLADAQAQIERLNTFGESMLRRLEAVVGNQPSADHGWEFVVSKLELESQP